MKRIVLKEELVAITGDYKLALVLNQMMYWSERTKQENGWIYKSSEELSTEMMMHVSGYSMRTYLKKLVQSGFLEERSNPSLKWDKTKQYRVHKTEIEAAIVEAGFQPAEDGCEEMAPPIEEMPAPKENNLSSKEEKLSAISETTSENTFIAERDADSPVFAAYEKLFGEATPAVQEKIENWLYTNDFEAPEKTILYALELAEKYKARSFAYADSILMSWQKKKLRTLPEMQQQPSGKTTTHAPLPKWLQESKPKQEEDFTAQKAEAARLKKELAEKREARKRRK